MRSTECHSSLIRILSTFFWCRKLWRDFFNKLTAVIMSMIRARTTAAELEAELSLSQRVSDTNSRREPWLQFGFDLFLRKTKVSSVFSLLLASLLHTKSIWEGNNQTELIWKFLRWIVFWALTRDDSRWVMAAHTHTQNRTYRTQTHNHTQ